ncbi:mitochondrial ribosomal protein S25 [Radiomyces spectabilis]|uniref:mitochondrial ribosomal protein S25 n=1 Tax=Radiomyces spectabilis TaxID=64574 RepID=UPI0022200DD9|nr:mitochondrial ribosomal protein S25 [Radiomyces spectabilis]KAI8390873.1 mitochondrial ribosomal protein S25 [Radiomyces spectabilis]
MAMKPAPNKLARHVSNLLKGGLLKEAPVWLPVMQTIPPGPSIIRSQSPKVDVFTSTASSSTDHAAHESFRSTRHKQKHLRSRPPKPQAIVYPEDRLRRQFFKDHPYELARPKVLVENESGINRTDFSQLMLPGMHPSEVDGEAVIKYQLHLMTHEQMPERKAYAQACSEFYDIRAQQEEEERQLREKMSTALRSLNNRKWSKHALFVEEQALRNGQQLI